MGAGQCVGSTPLALPCVVVARQVTQTLHSAARGRRTRHTGSDLFESVLPGPHSDIQKCQVSVESDGSRGWDLELTKSLYLA